MIGPGATWYSLVGVSLEEKLDEHFLRNLRNEEPSFTEELNEKPR